MKILSAEQIRKADQFTIQNEPISSLDLMERAALHLFEGLIAQERSFKYLVFCGTGNNGGDGLVLTRLLQESGREARAIVLSFSNSTSPDFDVNLSRLRELDSTKVDIWKRFQKIEISSDYQIIDAIFGTGLSRPLEGEWKKLVSYLNEIEALRIAIDIPSGLIPDQQGLLDEQVVFRADKTYSFQVPKLAFMHSFTAPFVGDLEILDIGLDPTFLQEQGTDDFYLTREEVASLYRPRQKFTFKNSFGHLLLFAGSTNKAGAGLIAAEASLRSGVGLTTAAIPRDLFTAANSRLPELMLLDRDQNIELSSLRCTALAIGPGMGLGTLEKVQLERILDWCKRPIVLDADALQIMAQHRELLDQLPKNAVLTPHIGEWNALMNQDSLPSNYWEQLTLFCAEKHIYVLLKNTISVLVTPNGKRYHADLGHPVLAKGGSGDILCGLIGGFLAQGYGVEEACKISIYIQGEASKASLHHGSPESQLSSDILQEIGTAFKSLEQI